MKTHPNVPDMVAIMGAYEVLNYIPVAALTGIMLVVVIHSFKWFSISMILAVIVPKQYRARFNLDKKIPGFEVVIIVVDLSIFVVLSSTNA